MEIPTEQASNLREEIKTNNDAEEGDNTNEQTEDMKSIPSWKDQLTLRGLFTSLIIGVMYSVIVMKLNLTTGLVPTLNVSTALLAFVILKSWTKLLLRFGVMSKPFTRQENTVVQTCVVACYSIAWGGGFGSYLLGLNKKTYDLTGGASIEGNQAGSYKEPTIGWMTAFLFVTSFAGLLILVPLRKLINHGICSELIERIKGDISEFFKLPLEEKEKFSQLPGNLEGYGQLFVIAAAYLYLSKKTKDFYLPTN